jgi:hypothetical protein
MANSGKKGQMTAHDVRHITPCDGCGGIGDDRDMIQAALRSWVHVECAFSHLGTENILALPAKERVKLRLCDVPRDVMQKLLDLGTK